MKDSTKALEALQQAIDALEAFSNAVAAEDATPEYDFRKVVVTARVPEYITNAEIERFLLGEAEVYGALDVKVEDA